MVFVELKKSYIKGKKYTAIFYDDDRNKIKTTHFGSAGMSDYTKHKSDQKKNLYILRHSVNENWNDYKTAGALSRWILWNKTTIDESFNHYLKKFGLKKY
jgi:hypothetical protein